MAETHAKNLAFTPVEYVCGKAAVCSECLSGQGPPYSVILLCQISYCLSPSVHDDVLVGLFEAEENVHHLQLSLYDERAVVEQVPCWMVWSEDTIRIVGYLDRRDKVRGFIFRECCRDERDL